MPITSYPLVGVGEVFIGPDVNNLTSIGNNAVLKVAISEEVISEPDYITGQGMMNELRWIQKAELSIEPSDLKPANLAMALFGTTSVEAGATITDEAAVAVRGATFSTDESIATLTSVKHGQFAAGAWAGSAAVSSVTPTYKKVTGAGGGAPTWIVKCTTSGTTSGTEPTWSEDAVQATIGTTINDGTAVWTYVGLATLVADVDYTLVATGVMISPFARIANNDPVLVTYVSAAYEVIEAATSSGEEYYIRFIGKNRARSGKAVITDFYRVRFGPAQELSLIDTTGFAKVPLTGTILADTSRPDNTSQYFTIKVAP